MKSRPTHRAYFISGLACGAVAFERIKTPEHVENVFLEWQIPNKNEPIQDYAKRFVKQIKTDLPFYLIGLSFGGIMVQEVAQYISPKKIILISSVKSRKELPKRIKLGKYLPLHRLLMGKKKYEYIYPFLQTNKTICDR